MAIDFSGIDWDQVSEDERPPIDFSGIDFGSLDESAEPETGFASNALRGAGERAMDLGGNLVEFIGNVAKEGERYLTEATGINPGIRFGDDGISFTMNLDPEETGNPLARSGQAISETGKGADYQPRFTWERLKGDVTAKNLAGYITEQGVKSVPDMAAALTTLPAYIASRTEEIGEVRAENKGLDEVGARELGEAFIPAVAASLLERIGAKGVTDLAPVSSAKDVLKEAGKAAGREGATEFVQEQIEYAGETVGTNTDFDLEQSLDRGFAGAVAGSGMGATVRGATATKDLMTPEKAVADARERSKAEGGDQLDQAIAGSQAALEFAALPPPSDIRMEPTGPEQVAGNSNTGMEHMAPGGRMDGQLSGNVPQIDFSGIDELLEQERIQQEQKSLAARDQEIDQAWQDHGAVNISELPPERSTETDQLWNQREQQVSTPMPDDVDYHIDQGKAGVGYLAKRLGGKQERLRAGLARRTTPANSAMADAMQSAMDQANTNPQELGDKGFADKLTRLHRESGQHLKPALRRPNKNRIIPDRDEVMTAVRKLGGLDIEEAVAQGIDPEHIKDRPGKNNPFRRGGRSLDDLAEGLQQYGYQTPDANSLLNLVSESLGGRPQYTPEGAVNYAEQQQREELQLRALDDTDQTPIEQGLAPQGDYEPDATPHENILADLINDAIDQGVPETTIDAILNNEQDSAHQMAGRLLGETYKARQHDEDSSRVREGVSTEAQNPEGSGEIPFNEGDPGYGQGPDLAEFFGITEQPSELEASNDTFSDPETQAEWNRLFEDKDENGLTHYERSLAESAEHYGDDEFSRRRSAADLQKELDEEGAGETLTDATREAILNPAPVTDIPSAPADRQTPKFEDFGEQIGGARKDMGITRTSASKPRQSAKQSADPSYFKRYEIGEIAAMTGEVGKENVGKFRLALKPKGKRSHFNREREIGVFDTEQEARQAIHVAHVAEKHRVGQADGKYHIYRNVTRGKYPVIKDGFDSREEAMRYMVENAEQIIQHSNNYTEAELRPNLKEVVREGKERRSRDVTPGDFQQEFGFRGGQFGNWNNSADRQDDLNYAFDGLMDLAETVGVEPKALSLNGDLAIAFGARGQGLTGASAHYEPGYGVINLTKMKGAGSLAHEWLHALDHYLGRLDGKAGGLEGEGKDAQFPSKKPDKDFASHGFQRYNSQAREEVRDAFEDVVREVYYAEEQYIEDATASKEVIDRQKTAVMGRLTSIRESLEQDFTDSAYRKRYKKPASEAQLKEFDRLASRIASYVKGDSQVPIEWKLVEGSKSWKTGHRSTNDDLEAMSALLKKVRGRAGWGDRQPMSDLSSVIQRYNAASQKLAESTNEKKKTRRVPTNFRAEATKLDLYRVSDYWSTEHEMLARAFEGFVQDKIAEGGGRSDYLVAGADNNAAHLKMLGVKPYPEGPERQRINQAFQKLFDTLESRTTDRGVALYSATESTAKPTGIPVLQAKLAVKSISNRVGVPITVVETEADLPPLNYDQIRSDGAEGRVRGLFDPITGKSYIVAGNLRSPQEATEVYLHEVRGHMGVRAIAGKRLNMALDQIYRDMPQEQIDRLRDRYSSQLEGKGAKEQERIVADEYVAYLAENDPSSRGLKKVISVIRNWIRQYLPRLKWTDADIVELLKAGENKLRQGNFDPDESLDLAPEQQTMADVVRMFDSPEMQEKVRDGREKLQSGAFSIGDDFDAGGTEVAKAMSVLAENDELFKYPVSKSKSIEDIASEVDPGSSVKEIDPDQEDANRAWHIQIGKAQAKLYDAGGELWIDAVASTVGAGGSAIYAIVGNYAYNNNKVFIGDPGGFTSTGVIRRAENMLSSALKYGTTRHLDTGPDFDKARQSFGLPAIKWTPGDDIGNIQALINANYANVAGNVPDIENISFDFASGKFRSRGSASGRPTVFRDNDFARLVLTPAARKARAGVNTLKRSVLSQSLLQETRGEGRSQLLEKFLLKSSSVLAKPLKRSFYSLADDRSEASPDQDREALAKLGLVKSDQSRLSKIIKKFKDFSFTDAKDRAYEGAFDGLIGIKRAEDEAGAGMAVGDFEGSGYVGARLATGVSDTMHAVLHYGAPEWSNGVLEHKAGTRGLLEIFTDLDGDLNSWLGWMAGNRASELMAEGRENNLTQDDIDQLTSLANGKEELFESVRQEYLTLNNAMLDMAQEAGLINRLHRKRWASEWYVPFYRQDETGDNLLAPRSKRGLSHQTAGIKALKGGETATNDLLENILTNWLKLTDSAMKNMALMKTVDNLGDSEFLTDESMKYTEAIVPKTEVTKRIQADRDYLVMVSEMLGLPDAGELETLHELEQLDSAGYEKLWAITAPRDPDVIRVQRNGRSKYYRVNDESLLRGLVHLSNEGNNGLLMRTGRYFKRLLTTGVTSSPDFILRNFVRDAAHAWAINPDGFKFGVDSMKGLKEAMTEDDSYRELMFAGASFQGGYVHGTDPEAGAQLIRRALEKKGLTGTDLDNHINSLADTPEKTWRMIQRGWQAYRNVSDKVENANRLATFQAAKKSGKSLAQAIYESKDLMDYSLRGNWAAMNVLTDLVPFLNARLQGLSKLGRAGKEHPHEVSVAIAKIALASVALAMINDDDERYQQLPDWEKDAYWHVLVEDEHFRIPKPFEIGIIAGTIPERMYHTWIADNQPDEKLLWSLKHGTLETLSFNPVPQAVLPILELWGNKSWHFDTPIESLSDQRKLPQDRYNARTSDTMVELGQFLGMSPKQLEHLLKGYTGTMGAYALSVSDLLVSAAKGKPNQGEIRPTDIPVVKSFYRGSAPAYSTQYVTDLYDRLSEVKQIHASLKDMEMEERADFYAKNRDKLRYRKYLEKESKKLRDLRKRRDRILKNETMSRTEKSRRLDYIQKQINTVAARVVERTEGAF
ncbi:hypothetical protein HBA55_29755 [Pseudomaricurvus alkylphenolicus]|uniref:LPD38 domain-containing protein n=1 Tax=Pseudomaricurvus alkylphenolicus TaxID=1306991 RepID=UPI00141FA8C1|nr:LPD38 domain-containing protein [Pseudomaricurvus alkylphenolicus]NIB43825.1 hypothetical protein [Pseudomaricurvus alkylphenolicus]